MGMILMSSPFQEGELTPDEREQARGHWNALMFAPSRGELDKAQLALLHASVAVRSAVVRSINEFWLRDYEPRENENPF
jgi:hypothetical protein